MSSGLKITFVAGGLSDGGGANRVISDLSAILAERLGADVEILAIGSSGEPTYPVSDRVRLETHANGRPLGWRGVLSRLRRGRRDFVIGSWTQLNIVLILVLLFTPVKVIVVEHTSWYFHRRWSIRALRRIVYPLAWRVIVLNPAELAYYSTFVRDVRMLPNPVQAIPGTPLPEREKLIVAIGHLEPRKNFIDAVRAMALSRLEESGWELAIIGAGPEEHLLHEAIRHAGLARTRIHSPTTDLVSWYNRASLTLITAKLEVFSLVLAEAMSAGVIPIAYAADGPSFILKDFPGYLVPIGDLNTLANRLRKLAAKEIPMSLRREVAASIRNRFSPESIAEKWRQMLDQADRPLLPDA